MKKILLLLTVLLFAMGARAQKDIVSMADAIKIFQAKTLQVGKQVLEKQGYSYKGVSSDEFGKDYNLGEEYEPNQRLPANCHGTW